MVENFCVKSTLVPPLTKHFTAVGHNQSNWLRYFSILTIKEGITCETMF